MSAPVSAFVAVLCNRSMMAYATFAKTAPAKAPDETIKLTFEKVPGGRGGYNRWTINGKSWPDTNPLFTVQEGKHYWLLMHNNSGDVHPVHTHRHTFEVTKVGDRSISGLMKDTLSMPRYTIGCFRMSRHCCHMAHENFRQHCDKPKKRC
jgi:FtsP/CotA-like multicopper oxidase with cupredoxin domain